MTGGEAKVSNVIGESFSVWDGYISGKNIALIPATKIVQSWRTLDFKDADEDSILEIEFEENAEDCQITLRHSNIPEGSPDYETGWENHYFKPMRQYFGA